MIQIKNFHGRLRAGVALLLIAVLALAAAPLWAQGSPGASSKYQEGLHYFKIDQAGGGSPDGKVEVVEAFSYLCPHCNTFEPFITEWLKHLPEHVKFTRMPVIFGRKTWELYARAYVTAEMMGIADQGHGPLMDAIYKEKRVMRDMDELADFFSQFGVSANEFKATSESFAVDARLRKDQRQTQAFGVSGTPSMIVNGKYLIKGSQAVSSYDTMLDVVDTLVAQEIAAMASNEEASEPEAEAAESDA